MSYTVSSSGARTGGLPSTTPVVLWSASLDHELAVRLGGSFDHATVAGPTFSFFAPTRTSPSVALNLTTETLASAAVGALVLVDPTGGGIWKLATVVNDGSGALAGDGVTVLPSSTPAAPLLTDNGQGAPPVGSALTLIGTASDGMVCFSYAGGAPVAAGAGLVFCSPISTVGALSSGVFAAARVGAAWQVVEV
jgi:hypothetical protein